MDLRQLKYFLAVAEELNISRAAERLHISQPPLTRNIKALEEELGVKLFHRSARGVELTQAGEMFREDSNNIRMLVEAAVDRVQRAGEGKLGRLDVGIFGSAVYEVIPSLLQTFRERLPGVSVVLHTMNKSEQLEALRQRRITVAFNRILQPAPDIGRELVVTEPLFVVLPKHHRLTRLESVPVKALAGEPLVLFPNVGRPNFADRVIEMCNKHGFEAQVSQEVGDAITGAVLVARGFGITLIPASAAKTVAIEGTTYRPLADGTGVDLSCFYRASDRSPLLHSFLEVVREYRARHAAKQPPSA
ncbi:LysR family transcriptional regulator [Hydrogenophaga sp. 5NK40-0174]|uniref:LysR family transcriptional regulator n=1 Tax=Hydrogenophaga sp. 5NK40-0174 TaxID=3127649 RepID=UPI00310BC8F9